MKNHVHLSFPPNVVRRLRTQVSAKFPGLKVGAPFIHREMFDYARSCGQESRMPALCVSAYPQLLQNVLNYGSSRFEVPQVALPPLRGELLALGLKPPRPEISVVAVVPCLLACNNDQAPGIEDWEDLCHPEFKGILGVPPLDTPLPYLISSFLKGRYGMRAQAPLSRMDTASIPLDINRRVDEGALAAGLLIPAFSRSFRSGRGRMVWPTTGAIAVPLIACIGKDAPPEAHDALAYLLSYEIQSFLSQDGDMVPVRADIRGFEELEATRWRLIWPGWDQVIGLADPMTDTLLNMDADIKSRCKTASEDRQ